MGNLLVANTLTSVKEICHGHGGGHDLLIPKEARQSCTTIFTVTDVYNIAGFSQNVHIYVWGGGRGRLISVGHTLKKVYMELKPHNTSLHVLAQQ